jgi:hypothetical protein
MVDFLLISAMVVQARQLPRLQPWLIQLTVGMPFALAQTLLALESLALRQVNTFTNSLALHLTLLLVLVSVLKPLIAFT